MRLLDLRLDYKAMKVSDQRFTLEMYYILLSFVDCAPRPYHGGFFGPKNYVKGMDMILYKNKIIKATSRVYFRFSFTGPLTVHVGSCQLNSRLINSKVV